MSKYTTEVRYICETSAGQDHSSGYNKIDEILTAAAPVIFSFPFPIFDENYRTTLEKKILRHYYTREICEETVGLWKLRLEDRLNMIMPYYNQLYSTTLFKFNPLYDADLYTVGDRNHDGSITHNESNNRIGENSDNRNLNVSESDKNFVAKTNVEDATGENSDRSSVSKNEDVSRAGSENNSENRIGESSTQKIGNANTISSNESHSTDWKLYSDTPQGGINGIEGTAGGSGGNVGDMYYLTTAEKDTNDTSGKDITNTGNSSTEEGVEEGSTFGRKENTSAEYTSGISIEDNAGKTNNTSIQNGYENGDRKMNSEHIEVGARRFNEQASIAGNQAINNTDSYINHVFGKSPGASYSKLIDEFRKIILNIDEMIINELSDLFFGLWA